MSEQELKPCPFCGGNDLAIRERQIERDILCNDCHTLFRLLEYGWLDTWNTRASDIEELEMYRAIVRRWYEDQLTGEEACLKMLKQREEIKATND